MTASPKDAEHSVALAINPAPGTHIEDWKFVRGWRIATSRCPAEFGRYPDRMDVEAAVPIRLSTRSDHDARTRRPQLFTIVMLTPRISPLELICTVCLLPLVRKVRLAANPEASTNTSIWPPPAVPCRLPKIFRLASLQLPEIRSPWLVTLLLRMNL